MNSSSPSFSPFSGLVRLLRIDVGRTVARSYAIFLLLGAIASRSEAIAAPSAATDSAFVGAFRASLVKSFEEASGKILSLADAIPEDKYGWRPMEGVNSVREVLIHVTETNYHLAGRLGVKVPVGIDADDVGKSMQTKAEAIAATKKSVDFMRKVLLEIPAEELLPEVDVFGSRLPKLRVALLPVDHAHEHLGQLIAYARMNRIVPPWSK